MDNSNSIRHLRMQTFCRFMAYSMTLTAIGCRSWWGFPPPNKISRYIFNLVKWSLMPIPLSAIVYFYLHFNDINFDIMCNIISITTMQLSINIKIFITCFPSFKQVMKNFIERYHLYNIQSQSEYNKMILKKVEKISRFTAIAAFSGYYMTGIFWAIYTLTYNVLNREMITQNKTAQFQSILYLELPFDYLYDINWMIVYYCFNVVYISICIYFLSTFDIITYIPIYHLIGHIVILKHEIKTKLSDNLSQNEVKERIIEIIEHHNFIIKAFKDVQSTFGLSVSGNYLCNLITNTFLMYMMLLEPANAFRYGLTLLVYFSGSTVTSLIFEEIRRQCYDLSEILYDVPWENMSISNQKSILIMLAQMQPPLIFVAAGGLVAGLQPLIFIIKTTFSYYVMLKSLA